MSDKIIHQRRNNDSFSNDGGLISNDTTKDYADRNTGGPANSLHEATQLG